MSINLKKNSEKPGRRYRKNIQKWHKETVKFVLKTTGKLIIKL